MSTGDSISTDNSDLTRLFIWSVPRTLGTALTKCLSYVDGMQVFNEPCVSAYHFGPEGITPNDDLVKFMDSASANQKVVFEKAFDDSECTYGWVRQQLEADYPGKKFLLVKDQAYCLRAKYDTIPPGFRHAFLIRHPYKVLPSWKRVLTTLFQMDYDATKMTAIPGPDPSRTGGFDKMFETQLNLLNYVQENFDPNPVIIDSDDLQNNPSSILRQFCEAVGIPFSESLLEWPANRDIMTTWKGSRIAMQGNLLENEGGFYENALRSCKFLPITATPKRSQLPEDIQELADDSMPFYEKMYQKRIKP